jgi:hypothetical protein
MNQWCFITSSEGKMTKYQREGENGNKKSTLLPPDDIFSASRAECHWNTTGQGNVPLLADNALGNVGLK